MLPGRIALYQAGTFLGMTDIEFVAEGETFSVYMGVADRIKLARALDRKRSSLLRGSRTKIQVSFVLSAENLSEQEMSLSLADRVPVSETKAIRVYGIRIEPDGKPDEKGLLKWDLVLKPKEKRTFEIDYTSSTHFVDSVFQCEPSCSSSSCPVGCLA